MATQIVNGVQYMEDHAGKLVPADMIKPADKLQDDLVMEMVKKACEINAIISDFKSKSMADIASFVQLSAEQYKAKIGGEKGNVSLFSFDGKYKVVRSMNDYIVFDEKIQIAKALIDECVREWSNGTRSELQVLVNHAFEVDKQGKMNTDRILGLRRLDIKDEKWVSAMNAISDSVRVVETKAYIRIYKKVKNDRYEQINLDIASM